MKRKELNGFVAKGVLRRLAAKNRLVSRSLLARSRVFVVSLPKNLEIVIPYWLVLFLLAGLVRIATSPSPPANFAQFAEVFLPYGAIALAPALALRLADAAFPASRARDRLDFHLASIGRWKPVTPDEASRARIYGPFGFIASLLIGLLLTVPLRGFEFVLAVPALHSDAPEWGRTIFLVMAFEAAAMSFLYIVCFVLALRSIPLFPRMLAVVWGIDICFQLGIAQVVAAQPDLPRAVAVPMTELLAGNVTKVLISVAVWLPYLILSERVNLTYRHRVAAD